MTRIFWIIVVVVVLVVGLFYFKNRAATKSVTGGDVFVHEQGTDATKTDTSVSEKPVQDTSADTTGTQTAASTPGEPAPMQTQSAAVAPPATDSIARNPPNGMIFAGTGHYQLYRQGDITWRINTDTGVSCVIFATDEQWRKARVYEHGCRMTQGG